MCGLPCVEVLFTLPTLAYLPLRVFESNLDRPALQIWIMAAQFEVRQLRLDAARKILGMAIGMCPKVRESTVQGFFYGWWRGCAGCLAPWGDYSGLRPGPNTACDLAAACGVAAGWLVCVPPPARKLSCSLAP